MEMKGRGRGGGGVAPDSRVMSSLCLGGRGVFIYNQRRDRLPSSLSLARTRGDEKGEGQCGGGITPNSRNSRY